MRTAVSDIDTDERRDTTDKVSPFSNARVIAENVWKEIESLEKHRFFLGLYNYGPRVLAL